MLHYSDIPLSDGLLAAENGSLNMTAAGLPQRNECIKRHGRIVFSMDTLGMGDIIGLACKQSVYRRRKKDIDALIRMWLDCSSYVLSDLDHRSELNLLISKPTPLRNTRREEFRRLLVLRISLKI